MVNVFSFWCRRCTMGSALTVRWTIRILKTQPAWLCGVLSSSIQFRRDIISILLTSFLGPYCKLHNLFVQFQFMAHVLRTQAINWNRKNAVRNSNYIARTRLVRGISKKKLTDLPITKKITLAPKIKSALLVFFFAFFRHRVFLSSCFTYLEVLTCAQSSNARKECGSKWEAEWRILIPVISGQVKPYKLTSSS